jgi:hypothetical protein
MQGNERTGVLLLILLILVTEYWSDWRRKKMKLRKNPTAVEAGYLVSALSHERFNNMIKALGLMITFESFMRWDRIPRDCLESVSQFMSYFVD